MNHTLPAATASRSASPPALWPSSYKEGLKKGLYCSLACIFFVSVGVLYKDIVIEQTKFSLISYLRYSTMGFIGLTIGPMLDCTMNKSALGMISVPFSAAVISSLAWYILS